MLNLKIKFSDLCLKRQNTLSHGQEKGMIAQMYLISSLLEEVNFKV
jgi:hypothetical protein